MELRGLPELVRQQMYPIGHCQSGLHSSSSVWGPGGGSPHL